MSECCNETLEYCILNDEYNPSKEEVKELAQELWNLKQKEKNGTTKL